MFQAGEAVRLVAAVDGYPAGARAVVLRVIDKDVCEIRFAGSPSQILIACAALQSDPDASE